MVLESSQLGVQRPYGVRGAWAERWARASWKWVGVKKCGCWRVGTPAGEKRKSKFYWGDVWENLCTFMNDIRHCNVFFAKCSSHLKQTWIYDAPIDLNAYNLHAEIHEHPHKISGTHTCKQTNKQTNKHTHKQIYIHTFMHSYIQNHIHIYVHTLCSMLRKNAPFTDKQTSCMHTNRHTCIYVCISTFTYKTYTYAYNHTWNQYT